MRILVWGLLVIGQVACAENSTDQANEAFADYHAKVAVQQAHEDEERTRTLEQMNAELAAYSKRREPKDAPADVMPHSNAKEAPSDTIGDWLRAAPSECAFKFNQLACLLPPDGATPEQKQQCTDSCAAAIKAAADTKIADAFNECASATEKPTCKFEFPSGTDPSGKGEAAFREGMAAAEIGCATACGKQRVVNAQDAKEREKAAQQGNDLVLAYKRCMLATDGTMQAIRYRVHDTELYDDLMQKADARCRASNRCDWLEKYSEDLHCVYGN
jgi:hypothetical protein